MASLRRSGPALTGATLALLSALTFASGVLAGDAPGGVDWSYEDPTGPEDWGSLSPDYALCEAGRSQSPVDIPADAPRLADHVTFDYVPASAALLDTGEAVQVAVADAGTMEVDGGTYALRQFHFHTPSEHTLAGQKWAMEMHLVHADEAGSLAVVGVPIVEGAEHPAIAPIRAALPIEVGIPVPLADPIDVAALLPADRSMVGYPGSLTTPPCTEGVSWHVLVTPIELSAAQIATFRRIHDGTDRPTQPLGARSFEEP